MSKIKMLMFLFPHNVSLSILGILDNHLDSLAGVDVLESLLGILELDTTCDKLLDADTARGDEIKSQLVVAGPVSEAATHIYFFATNSNNREVDVRFAHATLYVGAAGSDSMDGSLDARLGPCGIDDGISTQSEVALVGEELGILLRANFLRAEDVRGSVLLSERETLLVDVNGNNLGSTK